MGSEAHPVGVGAEGKEGGLGAEVAQEFALGLGVGGGARFAWRSASTNEADAYVGRLDSGAAGEKEVAEGDSVSDAEGSLRIPVALLDAIFEGD